MRKDPSIKKNVKTSCNPMLYLSLLFVVMITAPKLIGGALPSIKNINQKRNALQELFKLECQEQQECAKYFAGKDSTVQGSIETHTYCQKRLASNTLATLAEQRKIITDEYPWWYKLYLSNDNLTCRFDWFPGISELPSAQF